MSASDDPTTKPCPNPTHGMYQNGGNVTTTCPVCHGTGRVPMTTGELLEALRQRFRLVRLFCDRAQDMRWGVVCWRDYDPNAPALEVEGDTPDDALRAALRAVSHE